MFYRPEEGHGLPHNPFNAVVSPRPIGWISTRVPGFGDNLAPYSYFNAVASRPPQVMFSGEADDTVANVLDSGVFAVNLVGEAALRAMNETSARVARGVDEFALAGVAKAECTTIDCPRVADAPATLECRVVQDLALEGGYRLVIGQVTGVHLRDDCLVAGRFDVTRFTAVARLGYHDYALVRELIEMRRPR
ncbi:flavin reductase family protein [Xinfangfangia pollutisoli]|uniref:flavin reductase family protein n=1 Tax=Xinfangfangia pollutisoli TaxID=2865960 RepID=UPI001CD4B5EE|nr:flavin reductase family protein [Xinfangfangia pollutisoli]